MRERSGLSSSWTMALLATASMLAPAVAWAYGEPVNGFPSTGERLLLELANRSRVDPQADLIGCTSCADLACYGPVSPLYYSENLNRAARFHAAHMSLNGYFAHESNCVLVQNIASIYPATCDGAAACSCSAAGSTTFADRVKLFGANPSFEIIAGNASEQQAFYSWLNEPFAGSACEYASSGNSTNGHRWALLRAAGSVGFGVAPGEDYVGDFASAVPATSKIPSGAHLLVQGNQVEFWADWFDDAGPQTAMVVIDGECHPMRLERGNARNGAWRHLDGGLATCSRYYFYFVDRNGTAVTYPTTGTFGVGSGTCADWEATRPATPVSCTCTAVCNTTTCADNACGGFCGQCGSGQFCSPAGACIADRTGQSPGTSGTSGTSSGTSGTSGTSGGETPELAGGHLCGCAAAPGGAGGGALALVALLALVSRARRRG